MKKKQYIAPLSEVTQLGPDVVMRDLGPASMPNQDFAPQRRWTDVF